MSLVTEKKYLQYKINIQHILNVIEEQIILYEKRKREVRRYLKTCSRANLVPDDASIFLLLEAELQYLANMTIFPVLTAIIRENNIVNENDLKVDHITQHKMYQELYDLLKKDDSFFVEWKNIFQEQKSGLVSKLADNISFKQLLKIIFYLDEDYQRKLLANIIQKHSRNLLAEIMKQCAIFDDKFLSLINKQLHGYLIDSNYL
jgi:hypothetical protein